MCQRPNRWPGPAAAACLLAALAAGAPAIALARAPARGAGPPNLVLLLADDLGWTGLGVSGSDLYETPHLDALARQGVRFTSAYSACTVCSPTRASIMTGKAPARLRLTDYIPGHRYRNTRLLTPDWDARLAPQETTIAERLRAAGYRTGHFGKWHLRGVGGEAPGTGPTDQGFDESYERPPGPKTYYVGPATAGGKGGRYLTDLLTDKACGFIDRSAPGPFFLYLAYNTPHTPIEPRPDLLEHFKPKVDPAARHTNPAYAAMVASLDQSVGRVVRRLERHGLERETVVLFFSDNGGLSQRNGRPTGFTDNRPLRRGKGSAYEGGVRVPAIVRWPGVTTPGALCHTPVITTDLFPTLCECAGLPPAYEATTEGPNAERPTTDGRSLVPLLRDASATFDRDLFWHYPHYHAGGDGPYSAVLSGRRRLIRFYEGPRLELYDLADDPGEERDLSAEQPKIAEELDERLGAWLASVGAQLPTPNPGHDPASGPPVRERQR